MPQALSQLHLQRSLVLRDRTGVTGQAIVRAIVAGARDPARLAALRAATCTASVQQIITALTGTWQAAQLFMLQQARALCDPSAERSTACDQARARMLATMESRGEPDAALPELPAAKPTSKPKHAPAARTRAQLARSVGVDRAAVTGVSAAPVQPILAEGGSAMSRCPTVKPCCAWLGLAPPNDSAGGTGLRSRTLTGSGRAGQAFGQAAQAVARSDSSFGAYFRAMRARKGPHQATVATAHTLARTGYALLKNQPPASLSGQRHTRSGDVSVSAVTWSAALHASASPSRPLHPIRLPRRPDKPAAHGISLDSGIRLLSYVCCVLRL